MKLNTKKPQVWSGLDSLPMSARTARTEGFYKAREALKQAKNKDALDQQAAASTAKKPGSNSKSSSPAKKGSGKNPSSPAGKTNAKTDGPVEEKPANVESRKPISSNAAESRKLISSNAAESRKPISSNTAESRGSVSSNAEPTGGASPSSKGSAAKRASKLEPSEADLSEFEKKALGKSDDSGTEQTKGASTAA